MSHSASPSPTSSSRQHRRRGWRRRYAYPSHGLRFELKAPAETARSISFAASIGEAQAEEEGVLGRASGRPERWLIGPYQRNLGSLHQDIWDRHRRGSRRRPVSSPSMQSAGGGRTSRRKDRADMPVRYALLVSLRTADQSVDLYTPVAIELRVPIETTVPGT